MSIAVTCPACGCHSDIEAFLADADGKRMAALFADLDPALGRAVLGYLRLFKPAKQALRLPRAARIVCDLLELVNAGAVSRDDRTGMRRETTATLWAKGIEQMIDHRDRITLPIDNHNYLRAIVFGLAEQQAARTEARTEEAKRTGQHRRTAPGGHTEAETAGDRETAFARQLFSFNQIDGAELDRRLAEIAAKYQGGA
ncbi:MAG: hypothetical protein Q8L45_01610 [Xanthomonadaceae bacterium]|nr:hypothetical protein [Xanthomonadaceae bacterium]MDP2185043.1 hypothetical protein [Xanthomonadales bacterium]MDZ4114422.1 hypothetical protein [Xanthomonadaceae bacterium]